MSIKAIGLIEVSGSVAAIDALDIMCKAASVTLVTWEKKLGGRLVTVIVTGDVSDVTAAVAAVTAAKDEEQSDDDDPNALVVENIAKAVVVHSISSLRVSGAFCSSLT